MVAAASTQSPLIIYLRATVEVPCTPVPTARMVRRYLFTLLKFTIYVLVSPLTYIGPPSEPLAGQTSVTFAAPLLPANTSIVLQYAMVGVPAGNFTPADFNLASFSSGLSISVTSTDSLVIIGNLVYETVNAFRYNASASVVSSIVFVATLPSSFNNCKYLRSYFNSHC